MSTKVNSTGDKGTEKRELKVEQIKFKELTEWMVQFTPQWILRPFFVLSNISFFHKFCSLLAWQSFPPFLRPILRFWSVSLYHVSSVFLFIVVQGMEADNHVPHVVVGSSLSQDPNGKHQSYHRFWPKSWRLCWNVCRRFLPNRRNCP